MIIGLTGGIASGKSTAARILGELGAHVIDADKLGHAAYEPNTQAFAQVVETFGDDIVAEDGSIDRRALGGKVFGDEAALKRLTDIVWPQILRMAQEEISAVKKQDAQRVVVLEAAVLLEAGWQTAMDQVWCVVVDPEVAIARATARDGVEASAVQARIDAQLSNAERISQADLVIDNSADEDALRAELENAWAKL